MPGEIDLCPRVVTAAFEHQDIALAKLGVKHRHADCEAMRRGIALHRHRWAGKTLSARVS